VAHQEPDARTFLPAVAFADVIACLPKVLFDRLAHESAASLSSLPTRSRAARP